ncbi:MAG: rRNA cytosine-C5-methyltransferase [Flavobacteriales bacterium]|nr:rRNA cytosine-C5-methyltransferase [Flavobacteriales bacterium]
MGRSAPKRTGAPGANPRIHHAFHDHLRALLGDEAEALEHALSTPSPVSIRVNVAKWSGPQADPTPWCATGRYLGERPSFTFDPLLHAGCYYVQEASSMLLEQAMKASGPWGQDIRALDLCAAPGGKTTHLRSLLSPGSLLVANEIDRKRQGVLQENLFKWGASNTVVSGSSPHELQELPDFFDLILVDAPCSGEGMFRKEPFAREQWSPALVQQCATTQRAALDHAWHSLRPGGTLIYSTCTWEEAENEAQIAHLMEQGATCIGIPVDPSWGVVAAGRQGTVGLRCYPHLVNGEGFFIAVLRKEGDRTIPSAPPTFPNEASHEAVHWLRPDRSWNTIDRGEVIFAVSQDRSADIRELSKTLRVLSPGIPLAERKGNDLRPHPALALSVDLQHNTFPIVELDRTAALNYLRGLAIPATDARGTALACYDGIALGWLHGAGNRWNNRWPVPWRIRAQQPSAPPVSWAHTSNKRA